MKNEIFKYSTKYEDITSFSCLFYRGKVTENALINFVERNLKQSKTLYITWFGGEPLMEKKLISRITERFIKICEEKNVRYFAGIVTNGYLFDDNIEQFFISNKISKVQITIDGTKKVHDNKRKLKDGRGTYDKIYNNLLKLRNIPDVSIRINIDKNNLENIPELIDELGRLPYKDNISPYFAKIAPYTSACENIKNTCIATNVYSLEEIKLYKLLSKNGFSIPRYPVGKAMFCGANNVNFYVIEPNGRIQKCWDAVGIDELSIGSIFEDNIEITSKKAKWIDWNPLKIKKCRECKVLPICFGGCLYQQLKNSDDNMICQEWKYNLEEFLKVFYTINKDKRGLMI